MTSEQKQQQIERPTVFERVELSPRNNTTALRYLLEHLNPAAALADVSVLDATIYRPTPGMLDYGFVDSQGIQHVFTNFVEMPDGTNATNRGRIADVISKQAREAISVQNLWCELDVRTDPAEQVSKNWGWHAYRYLCEYMGEYELAQRVKHKDPAKKAEIGLGKVRPMEKFLLLGDRSASSIDKAKGLMAEIWLRDALNLLFTLNPESGLHAVIAPPEVDASVTLKTQGKQRRPSYLRKGGDIMLLNADEMPVLVIDAKVGGGTSWGMINYNSLVNAPVFTVLLSQLQFGADGQYSIGNDLIPHLLENFQLYDDKDPLSLLSPGESEQLLTSLGGVLQRFCQNAAVKFEAMRDVDQRSRFPEFFRYAHIEEEIERVTGLQGVFSSL
jgi:hypothetical protein